MKTLIIPCAGKSSRFPGMRPKYLLTLPNSKLMVEAAIEKFDLSLYDRIIVTVVKKHDEAFRASQIIRSALANIPNLEICILEDFTKSASETIVKTIQAKNVKGEIVIKDSDNCVEFLHPEQNNFLVGLDLRRFKTVANIASKSFLRVNEQDIIVEVVEKQIVSSVICVGVYGVESAKDFVQAYDEIASNQHSNGGEIYISHVVSYMICSKNVVFNYVKASSYQDWGTLEEFRSVQMKSKTYFIDVDGVLLKNCGKYGLVNWDNNTTVIDDNIEVVRGLQEQGAQIIITTCRPETNRIFLTNILNEHGIYPYAMLMGLNHAPRVIINDFAPSNKYPSSSAVCIPRDGSLKDYI